ncbi:MAG: hypothetical protein HY775_06845 [Acidobacteria bacterium]|nr:hypothetical protein [Acidobacteriota bacterium]
MRRTALILGLALLAGTIGVLPAAAAEPPAILTFIEGTGWVCAKAGTGCTYSSDSVWNATKAVSQWKPPYMDGLYWPGVGPPAKGPWLMAIGGINPGTETCATTYPASKGTASADCDVYSTGDLNKGTVTSLGAYCGMSSGKGTITVTPDAGFITASFGWINSVGTNHIVQGTVSDSTDNLWNGKHLIGYMNTRGLAAGGNCGITGATTGFLVESFSVTY